MRPSRLLPALLSLVVAATVGGASATAQVEGAPPADRATGAPALAAADVATAAQAPEDPGEPGGTAVNGVLSWVSDLFPSIPCVGSPFDDPPTPLSRVDGGGGMAWSPDGRYVAASLAPLDGGPPDLLVIDVTDCSFRDLGPDAGRAPAWSPEGDRLAVAQDGDVVVISATTGEVLEQVTDTPGAIEGQPAWSPAGTLAYSTDEGIRAWPSGDLLAPGGSTPAFSPDGERIAYAVGSGFDARLVHAPVAGGRPEVLPDHITEIQDVTWSPDGRYLLYSGSFLPPGTSPDTGCFIITLDGWALSSLDPMNVCSSPAWQPLPPGSTPVPFPEPEPVVPTEPPAEALTLVYLFRVLDPTSPPGPGNSGTQVLQTIQPGHEWVTSLNLTGWGEVCTPGWAARQVQTVDVPVEDAPYEVDPAADPLAGLVVAERFQRLDDLASPPECDPAPAPTELTLTYLYRLLDPAAPPSWDNSGRQTLLSAVEGHAWPGIDATDLPADACGPGWAVQQEHTVGLEPDDVPEVIDPATGQALGDAVVAARHHSLGFYLDVPDCPGTDSGPEPEPELLTVVYLYEKLDSTAPPSWRNSGPQSLLLVRPGHAWVDLTQGDLPTGVCGPGWAVQQDFTVGLDADAVPTALDRSDGSGLGWGVVVTAARHHSLEHYFDVPSCTPSVAEDAVTVP